MKFIENLEKKWTEERGLLIFLLVLACLVFLIYPIADGSFLGKFILNSVIAILIASALVSVGVFKHKKWTLLFLAISVFISNFLVMITDDKIIILVHLVLRIIFLYIVASIILKRIFAGGKITLYRIAGSIIVYLLIGLIWALSYHLLYIFSSATFTFSKNIDTENDLSWNFIYYSYITLTTIGYGDILPNAPISRSMAVVEGLVGQLYPVVLIGRLVSSNNDVINKK